MRGNKATGYHSAYGGLWTDRLNALEELSQRTRLGLIDDHTEFLLKHWIKHGYVILEHAIDPITCRGLAAEIREIFLKGSEIAKYQEPEAPPGVAYSVPPGLPAERMRLVDLYGASRVAAEILMAPPIASFMRAIFDSDPLCFQGLTFEKGSGQGLHQDTAYVVVDRPLELAASWVALEDVREGSGELMYIEGSHRLPDWNFGGNSKHWDPTEHGAESHTDWSHWLVRKSEELGLKKRIFRPSIGDVLIWSADLVHGGSPIGDPSLTRRSIVGHYCPVGCTPHYFSYLEGRSRFNFGDGFFSSAYYNLNDVMRN
jgi:phytanoyl-CoA hydroxylase